MENIFNQLFSSYEEFNYKFIEWQDANFQLITINICDKFKQGTDEFKLDSSMKELDFIVIIAAIKKVVKFSMQLKLVVVTTPIQSKWIVHLKLHFTTVSNKTALNLLLLLCNIIIQYPKKSTILILKLQPERSK